MRTGLVPAADPAFSSDQLKAALLVAIAGDAGEPAGDGL
jgi:hypothetical protein